jgi:hypothetical protein
MAPSITSGAVMPSYRRPATKVEAFQCPYGTLAMTRSPRGAGRNVECARSTWTDAQKKTQHAAEQDRPDVAEARAAWRECQPDMNAARLVLIDETWATTNMARRYGSLAH